MPAWWLVCTRELTDLWIGGKALILILVYSILLGIMVYVLSSNSELSLIPPKEMVYETLKNAMAVSLFIGLIIGADSLSGERERATLESLLLTPTSRRQIAAGKFLAAVSPWPAALLIAVPYLAILAQGDEILAPAILWGAMLGSVLVLGYTGLGMLASFWSGSNKTSYFVSLGIYILFLVPAQLPGRAQTGAAGQFLQWVNPFAAANHFLSKHLVNYRTVGEFWTWLISPVAFTAIVLALLFLYAAPGLRLDAGKTSRFWSVVRRAAGLGAIACLLIPLRAAPALAFRAGPAQLQGDLQIAIDLDYAVVKTGDKVEFNTVVTNGGTEGSPPLIVAMNIINLDAEGDVVDPEDWSPERTQYIEALDGGQSATLSWIINTILDGDYMVYMVLIPEPGGAEATSQPVASAGIHLTVTPFTRLNPGACCPSPSVYRSWWRRAHTSCSGCGGAGSIRGVASERPALPRVSGERDNETTRFIGGSDMERIISRWMILALILIAGLALVACGSPATVDKEEPAHIEPNEDTGLSRITLTEKAAERIAVETVPVIEEQVVRKRAFGGRVVDTSSSILVRVALNASDLDRVDRSQPAVVRSLEEGANGWMGQVVDPPDPEEATSALYCLLEADVTGLALDQAVFVEVSMTSRGTRQKIVPYAAVLYDLEGETWVYTYP